jgi:hypothetical protein
MLLQRAGEVAASSRRTLSSLLCMLTWYGIIFIATDTRTYTRALCQKNEASIAAKQRPFTGHYHLNDTFSNCD